MKRKIYYFTKKYLTSNNILFILMMSFLVCVVSVKFYNNDFDIITYLDENIMVSFLIIAICDALAKIVIELILKLSEDHAKLNLDSETIVKKYQCSNQLKVKDELYPIEIILLRQDDLLIDIVDSPSKFYEVPDDIRQHKDDLMNVHHHSVTYNQICIRLDNIKIINNHSIQLFTSRTTYFDSLITNRACDYIIDKNKTIREYYEPGPYILPLEYSKMSNHIGFNGFLLTSDKKIPFVYRSNYLSIGKRTWGTSVSASMKTKYALSNLNNYELTVDSFADAIIDEIHDELGIDSTLIDKQDVLNSIFSFYRDLTECGKPQFSFFYQSKNVHSNCILNNFKNTSSSNDKLDKVKQDGKKIVLFSLEQLRNSIIYPDRIVVEGKSYPMMPSSIACVAMLLKYIEQNITLIS